MLEALKEGTILEKKRAGRVISYANPQLELLSFHSYKITRIICEAPLATTGVKTSRLASQKPPRVHIALCESINTSSIIPESRSASIRSKSGHFH